MVEKIRLGKKASLIFVRALLNPPKPNKALKKAAKKYHGLKANGELN